MKRNKKLFNDIITANNAANELIFCEQCVQTVEQHFSLPENFKKDTTRKREYVYARQICCYLIDKYTSLTLGRIGEIFNGKDHATVLHSKRTISNLMDSSKKIKTEVQAIEKLILYKMKVLTQKKSLGSEYYYINFDEYTSLRVDDNKGILLTGFTDYEIMRLIDSLELNHDQTFKHKNTGHYILEKTNTDDSRDTTSLNS